MVLVQARRPRVTLVATRVVPYVPGGGRLRWQSLTDALSRTAIPHPFTVAFDQRGGCAAGCEHGHHAAAGDPDDPFGDHYCPRLLDDLVTHVRATRSEVAVLTNIQLHRYARELAELDACRVVFDMHNAEYPLWREIQAVAPPYWRDILYPDAACAGVRRAEAAVLAAVDQVWTCSDADRRRVEDCYGAHLGAKLRVVPNVVSHAPSDTPLRPLDHVLYTGRFDYFPNALARHVLTTQIAPELARSLPDLPVVVAGAGMTASSADSPNVRLVPDPADVGPLIETGIMTVPLTLGGGTRFKILEALAVGAPVVSTAKGAEGIDLVDDVHYLQAEEPGEFVDAIADLVRNPARRRHLADHGTALIRLRYSVPVLAATLRRHLTELSASRCLTRHQ